MAAITNLATPNITTTWNGSSFDDTQSITVPVGSTHLLLRMVGSTISPTSVLFNSVALTQADNSSDTSTRSSQIWYLASPAIGTFNLVINTGGSSLNYQMSIDAISECVGVGAIAGSGGYLADRSLTLDTSVGDLVVDVLNSSQTATVGTGQTTQILNTSNMSASSELATTTSTIMSWTHAAAFTSQSAMVFVSGPLYTVSAPASAKTGDTVAISTTGLGTLVSATIRDANNNTVDVFSSDTQIVIPNFDTAGQQACLYSTVTLAVSDGTNSAETTFTLNPATGHRAVTASGLTIPAIDATAWNYGIDVADGDQSLNNDQFITHNADGSRTYNPENLGEYYTYVWFIIDAGNGILTKVTTNFESGQVVTVKINATKLTANKLSALKLRATTI